MTFVMLGAQSRDDRSEHERLRVQCCGHAGLAAELGDGWLPMGTIPAMPLRPAELRPKVARLRELTRLAGRPETAVRVCLGGLITFFESTGVDETPTLL